MKFTEKQRLILSDSHSHILGYIGGFGCGKTFSACYKGLFLSLSTPNSAGMLVSPTFPMLRDTTRRTFLEILETEGIGFNFRATENKIILDATNSEVWFRSADDPNRLKGSNLAWVGLDEAGQMSKEAFEISLSRARDPKANITQIFITSTPEGFNWMYDVFEDNPVKGTRMINASTAENTFLRPDYVERMRDSYDEKVAQQYIEGKFVNIQSGIVYHGFDRVYNVKKERWNPAKPIILCCDFNVNPMMWAIVQSYRDYDVVIDEIVLNDTHTEEMAREVKRRYPRSRVIVYGDFSGTHRHTASPTTDYDVMKKVLGDFELYIQQNPPVVDRINAMNARLCNSKGQRKLYVHPRCEYVIRDFDQVVWHPIKRDIDKTNTKISHISDAIGYFIAFEYPMSGGIISKQW